MLVGDQADRRPRQPLRRHPDHRRPGHARPDGAQRSPTPRSCSACSRARRPIPNDPATKTLPAAAEPRLHARSSTRTRCKGARIGIPRAFYYDKLTPPGRQGAARRPEPRPGQGRWPRRSRCCKRAGRRDRRSRRHPERRRHGPAAQPAALEHLLRRRQGQGQGRRLLDRLQVRHEARLQHVAGLPRRRARRSRRSTELRALEHRRTRRRARIKYGQSLLDISDEMDVEADRARYEADRAKRHRARRRRTASTR